MNRTILMLLLFFIQLNSYSQKGIKVEVNNSGDTTWSTRDEKIYTKAGASKSIGEILKSSIFKRGSNYYLGMFIQTGRTSVFRVSSGSIMTITMEDGEILELENAITNDSRSSSMGYGSFTSGAYRIPKEERKILKSQPVRSISINTSSGVFDYDLKGKNKESIGEQLKKFVLDR